MRETLRGLLPERCFLRYARSDDALFVSDCTRRLSAGETDALVRRLAENGYAAWQNERGLLEIDPSPTRYREWLSHGAPEVHFPQNRTLWPVFQAIRLLSAETDDAPDALLRGAIKRFDGDMIAFAKEAVAVCAQRKRLRQRGSRAAACVLAAWLGQKEGKP